MAELKFISETGMFHSACRIAWSIGPAEWYGFKPKHHRAMEGPGFVDRSDCSARVNHYVTFDISEPVLRSALYYVVPRYESARYILSVRDCVSFTADIARQANLGVPALNFSPYGFMEVLAFWNRGYTSRG